jgi:hypothetical protein
MGKVRGTDELDLSGAAWRKSTYSGGNGDCVEVAGLGTTVAVRDSKDPQGPRLVVGADEWRGFVADVRAGRIGA